MTARLHSLIKFALHGVPLLLALGLPAYVAGQGQAPDTTVARAPAKDLPLTTAQRQAFVGTYSVTLPGGEPGGNGRIFEENGVLKLEGENEGRAVRLLYQGDNVFLPEGVPNFIFTFVLENGRATKFTVRRPDGVMVGVRVP